MSGARDDRPGLATLVDYVREGDTVVIWKLDRLGRNTLHILETVKALTDSGVTLICTTDGIDSSTAAGRMVIGVLASMAEFERELIKERTALKRASSRANGTKFGRPRKVNNAFPARGTATTPSPWAGIHPNSSAMPIPPGALWAGSSLRRSPNALGWSSTSEYRI